MTKAEYDALMNVEPGVVEPVEIIDEVDDSDSDLLDINEDAVAPKSVDDLRWKPQADEQGRKPHRGNGYRT